MSPTPTDIDSVRTLPQLLAFRAAATPHAEAYRAFDPASQRWASLTWAATAQRVSEWARALAALQLPAGARVAILLPNGLNAMSMDQAALATGCVPVPLHAIDNPGSIAYILADCEASMLVVGHAEQWEKIRATGTAFPALRAVVIAEGDEPANEPAINGPVVGTLAQWLAGAAQAQATLPAPPAPDDLAAIVYTSGTTGKPRA